MTWKDAMIYIASIKWYMEERVEATKEYYDALDIALASMCSVSRDTVDKAWRGEWVEEVIKNCSECHAEQPWFYGYGYYEPDYCPNCGARMGKEEQA